MEMGMRQGLGEIEQVDQIMRGVRTYVNGVMGGDAHQLVEGHRRAFATVMMKRRSIIKKWDPIPDSFDPLLMYCYGSNNEEARGLPSFGERPLFGERGTTLW